MAANVNNANAASDGSPLNDLTHITNTLQDDPAQPSCLDIAISPKEHQHSPVEDFSASNGDQHVDDTVFNRLNYELEAIEALRTNRKSLMAELKTANTRLKALRKSYHRSRALYDNAVDPSGSLKDATSTQIDSNIATLRETSDRDRQALEVHSNEIRSIKNSIRTAQRALNRKQADFESIALRRPPKDDSSRANTDAQIDATNAPPPRPTPASLVQGDQPLLDRYLERAADVGIFGERLAELNYEYWTEVSQREMRQDRDETLSVSDEDFERYWQTEKEVITRDLDSAIRDADELLAACRTEGLVVEDNGHDQWDADSIQPDIVDDEHQLDRLHSLKATVMEVPQALFDDAEVIRADPSDDECDVQAKPKIVDRVGTWMEGVQVENIGMESIV